MTTATRHSSRLLHVELDDLHDQVIQARSKYKKLATALKSIPISQQSCEPNSFYNSCLENSIDAYVKVDILMKQFLAKTDQFMVNESNLKLSECFDAKICAYTSLSPGKLKLALNIGSSSPEQIELIYKEIETTSNNSTFFLSTRYPEFFNPNSTESLKPPSKKRHSSEE